MEDLPTTVRFSEGRRGGKDRKISLEKQKLIDCGRCPYHRGDNDNGRYRKHGHHDKKLAWK